MPIMRLRLAAQNLVKISRKPTGIPPRFHPPVMAHRDVDEVTLLAVASNCQPWRPAAKIKTLEAADVPFCREDLPLPGYRRPWCSDHLP